MQQRWVFDLLLCLFFWMFSEDRLGVTVSPRVHFGSDLPLRPQQGGGAITGDMMAPDLGLRSGGSQLNSGPRSEQ